MKSPKLKINHKVEFIFEEGNLGSSLIQDVQEEYFLITIPMNGLRKKMLQEGEEMNGIYYGEDKNVYMFECIVLDRIVERIPLYKLSMPETFMRIQRRNFVRIPATIPLLYMENTSELEEKIQKQELRDIEESFSGRWQRGNTLDLSGGGMKIHTKKPLKINQQIFCILQSKELYMGIKGKVIRCIPVIKDRQISYHLGIKFIDIPESKREKIIAFIFKKLRELRKKGW